jgi:hypothetical protein
MATMCLKAIAVAVAWTIATACFSVSGNAQDKTAPVPLVADGRPVDWWFAFKFDVKTPGAVFPGSSDPCAFGGDVQKYRYGGNLAYAIASADAPTLRQGKDMIGRSGQDPLGATFGEMFRGSLNYVVYNDQFYGDPPNTDPSCKPTFCDAPWAHSKGIVAWNDVGDGLILQVTTPSWPHSGSVKVPSTDGNTLGCVHDDNVRYAQDFFALRTPKPDLKLVLTAMANAGVLTFPDVEEVVHLRPHGPSDLAALASSLGDKKPPNARPMIATLSSGIRLVSKPANLHVPPWHYVSALLGGESLRVASWWTGKDKIPSFGPGKPPCWDPSLRTPGRVEVATTGTWHDQPIGLGGGSSNHAKVGVSSVDGHGYSIFGDMNQTGAFSDDCDRKTGQSARGGLFFVLSDPALYLSVSGLLAGDSAPDAN